MFKTAFVTALVAASVYGHSHHKARQGQWPAIKTMTTFSADFKALEWTNG